MKTIKQIADELGINKDKVKYRVGKLPVSVVKKTGEITYVTDEGTAILKDLLLGKTGEKVGNLPGEFTRQYVETLERELEIKNKQIDNQATQISDLTSALVAAQQTASAAQALHAATVKQNLMDNEAKPQEKGFFARIFGKKGD